MTQRIRHLIVMLALVLALPLRAQDAPALPAGLEADVAALTRAPHRLTGSPELQAAAAYVKARLEAIGVAQVYEQEFGIPVLGPGDAYLQAGEQRLVLQPMRPNLILPPVTPEEGVTGRLVDLGQGRLETYPEDFRPGDIAVMDYNSRSGWRTAFRLGAAAVIFVRQDGMNAESQHATTAPANFLRYYYDGERADLPVGQTVTLHGSQTWLRGYGRNIIAVIPGRDAAAYNKADPRLEEAIVLAAPLDSFGAVPERSPAARQAANVAALLQIAAYFQEHPPTRHVVLAFFDADAWGHTGAMHFYRLFDDQKTLEKAALAARISSTDAELTFQTEMLGIIDKPSSYPPADKAKGKVLAEDLKDVAADYADNLREKLSVLRLEASKGNAEAEKQIEQMEADKQYWNDVRRHLNDGSTWPADAVVTERLQHCLAEYRKWVERRIAELERQRAQQATETAIREQIGDAYIVLHISMLLGDRTGRWGLVVGDGSKRLSDTDLPGVYARVQTRFLAAMKAAEAAGESTYAEAATMDLTISQADGTLATPNYTQSGVMAGKISIYNVSLGTVQEAFPREGTPDDTLANLDLDRLARQLRGIIPVLARAEDDSALSLNRGFRRRAYYQQAEFSENRVRGTLARSTAAGGSSIPERATENVVCAITGNDIRTIETTAIPGYNDFVLVGTDMSGSLNYGPIMPTWQNRVSGFAATFTARGLPDKICDKSTSGGFSQRVNMYGTRHGALMHPVTLNPRITMNLLDGPSNGALQAKKNYFTSYDGVTTWFLDKKYHRVKLFEATGIGVLGSGGGPNAEASDAALQDELIELYPGTGFGISSRPAGKYDVNQQAARDVWHLNERRLAVLRERGIMNESLEELHGRAEDLWLEAEQSPDLAAAEAMATASVALQTRTYGPVRAMMDDLVKAVLILLALSVPFAFALERLLIGSPSIYRQIMWFVIFFLATFGLLYVSHPAFAIAGTPIIIFLGFTIVVLAAMVIVIIMQKFEQELKILQGMESTVHAADVSRLSTVLAAMSMGISSMRRRPLRTALTAVTIILLTFTILGFASFGTQRAVLTFFLQPSLEYAGVYVHQLDWNPMPGELVSSIGQHWGREQPMVVRRWLSPKESTGAATARVVISRADGSGHTALSALLGLEEAELTYRPKLAQVLQADSPFAQTVWMTRSAAETLGVKAGDTVLVNGRELVVGQPVDPVALIGLTDLDESSVLPVDFNQVTSSSGQSTSSSDQIDLEDIGASSKSWQSVSPDATLIVDADLARELGAQVHAITFYTENVGDAARLSEDLARILTLPVAGSRSDGIYRHVLGASLAASGMKSLIFPILLGGLVIFGTMLGSVADREKEIYTFSALGLAPPHVAGLFFAEAMIYSVIGGLGGYLLAQGSMKVLELLATQGLVRVPEMNYSSTNAIVTIILVMLTVMVSAIYPAIKASHSANPGVMRSWKIPMPVGDTLNLVFPFTVSQYDITGVVSFLKEHFDSFSDVGLGVFMTMNSELIRTPEGNFGLRAQVALAPFDLGVTQSFTLTSTPSEIEGIDEVSITITRLSGQPKDWQRQNKVLLDDLRKQFLLWRALPAETMEMYRLRTMQAMGDAPVASAASRTPKPA